MQRLYSMFPRGGPGTGLVLLRISTFASLCILAEGDDHWAVTVFIVSLGVGFLAGLMTPVVSALSIASMLVIVGIDARVPGLASFTLLLQSFALILLGPGGYSLDARIYGRRIVDVERRD